MCRLQWLLDIICNVTLYLRWFIFYLYSTYACLFVQRVFICSCIYCTLLLTHPLVCKLNGVRNRITQFRECPHYFKENFSAFTKDSVTEVCMLSADEFCTFCSSFCKLVSLCTYDNKCLQDIRTHDLSMPPAFGSARLCDQLYCLINAKLHTKTRPRCKGIATTET
jgi:hypothetical protein